MVQRTAVWSDNTEPCNSVRWDYLTAFPISNAIMSDKIVLSCVRGSVTNNNVFWIGWLDDWIYWHFDYNCNKLYQTTINDCLRLAPFLPRLRAFSLLRDWIGSDLPIDHFFSFRCRLLNTPQLNTELSYECRMIELSRELNWTELNSPFLTSRRAEYRSPSRKIRLLLRLFVDAGTCVNFVASRCLAMDLSGYQASYHSILIKWFNFWTLSIDLADWILVCVLRSRACFVGSKRRS
jgi:hypothetical protein